MKFAPMDGKRHKAVSGAAEKARISYSLAEFLKQNPTRAVSIEGHTDDTGSESYNLDLSQRRAEAVRDFLITSGVSPERISARGQGEAYPRVSNSTAAGRQQNRRVEVVVMR